MNGIRMSVATIRALAKLVEKKEPEATVMVDSMPSLPKAGEFDPVTVMALSETMCVFIEPDGSLDEDAILEGVK